MITCNFVTAVHFASSLSPIPAPPRTTAYNHPGTYLGEFGLRLLGRRLYVRPGGYLQGFSNVSLDGLAVGVSPQPIQISAELSLTRPSPHLFAPPMRVVSRAVSFSLVNADHFVNIESAETHIPYSPSLHFDGLLGQTADPDWKVEKTAEWRRHLELDHLLPTDDLFAKPDQQ